MPELNCDIPPICCLVRAEFLYNLEKGHGEFYECMIFGLASIQGLALTFHCMLANGAQFARLPIHAFAWNREAPTQAIDELMLWNCFSYNVTVTPFTWLRDLRVDMLGRNKQWYPGQYLFTVDWYGSSLAEDPGEGGFKQAHILKLQNGNYAGQPNNRLRWHEPSFITKPFPERPDYITNAHVWSAEQMSKWVTEDSGAYFYDVKVKK